MILTVCPNPSVDCTVELDALNVGMLNRVRNKVETYSGKALNVAKAVARLNAKSFATGFMFEENGKIFEHVLAKEGVGHKFIYNPGSARLNYKIIDKRSMLTEINDKGCLVVRKKQEELLALIKKLSLGSNIVVISGSLPEGVDASFYGEAVGLVSDRARIVIDAERENMRAALSTGREIYMVKPNVSEFENFTETNVHGHADIVRAAKKYLDAGVKYVMVSLGADGAIITDGHEGYYCKSASVAVNSTVGAGDCMVAAACVSTERGDNMSELLRCAVAAGTAAITTSGTNLFYKDKYDEIYAKIFTEKINV